MTLAGDRGVVECDIWGRRPYNCSLVNDLARVRRVLDMMGWSMRFMYVLAVGDWYILRISWFERGFKQLCGRLAIR
jgi:hypothetical protein